MPRFAMSLPSSTPLLRCVSEAVLPLKAGSILALKPASTPTSPPSGFSTADFAPAADAQTSRVIAVAESHPGTRVLAGLDTADEAWTPSRATDAAFSFRPVTGKLQR